jgi:hypothetical protein
MNHRLASAAAWRLELDCRDCGRTYPPTRADLLAGPDVYRVCPTCRDKEDDDERGIT